MSRSKPRWQRDRLVRLYREGLGRRVRFGSLHRVTPLSRDWGYDRGEPIDRHYIARFLDEHRQDIHGHVLELADSGYTTTFGDTRVTQVDVLHRVEGNPAATIIADLEIADHPRIPSRTFDCIIFTQALQLIFETRHAIANLHRALRPGGVLLGTMPGLSSTQQGSGPWADDWCFGFTSVSLRRLFGERFGVDQVQVDTFGNVLSAAAFLYGIASQELGAAELGFTDPSFPVTLGVRAMKLIAPEIGS
jgi:SAM-dependent methyltransferase